MVLKAINKFSKLLLVICYVVAIAGLYLAAFPGSSSAGIELLSLVVLPVAVGMVGVVIAANAEDFVNVLGPRPVELSSMVQIKIATVGYALLFTVIAFIAGKFGEAIAQVMIFIFAGGVLTMLCLSQSAKAYWADKIKNEPVNEEACNSIRMKDFTLRSKVTVAVAVAITVLAILGHKLEGWPDMTYLCVVLLYLSYVGYNAWGEIEDHYSWYGLLPKVVLVGQGLASVGWFFIPVLAFSFLDPFVAEISDYIFLGAVASIATGLLITRYGNRCVVKHLDPQQPEAVIYRMRHLVNLLSLVIYALAVLDGVLLSIIYLYGDFDRFDYIIYLVAGVYIPVYLYLRPVQKLEAAGARGRRIMEPVFYKAAPVVVLASWLYAANSMLMNIS